MCCLVIVRGRARARPRVFGGRILMFAVVDALTTLWNMYNGVSIGHFTLQMLGFQTWVGPKYIDRHPYI